MYQKKLFAKMWQKYALFPLLLMFVKLVLLTTFLELFLQLFQRIWNQHEILLFLIFDFWFWIIPFLIKKNNFRAY